MCSESQNSSVYFKPNSNINFGEFKTYCKGLGFDWIKVSLIEDGMFGLCGSDETLDRLKNVKSLLENHLTKHSEGLVKGFISLKDPAVEQDVMGALELAGLNVEQVMVAEIRCLRVIATKAILSFIRVNLRRKGIYGEEPPHNYQVAFYSEPLRTFMTLGTKDE